MDSKEAAIYTAVIISAIVIGIIIIFFVVSIINQQRRNLVLYRKNILTEITTLEKERSRIAADLHDELGPALSTIKFRIEIVDSANEEDQEHLEKASSQIDQLVGRLREITANLMPSALIRKGLVTALEEFTTLLEESAPLKVEFFHENIPAIPEEIGIHIFRLIQEVTQNTLKHAAAEKLSISLKNDHQLLHIFCHDNGKGFDYEAKFKASTGLGLRNLKSRVELMGGTIQVESKTNIGTSYLFKIPIQ